MSCLIYPGPDFGTEIVRCDDCSQQVNFTGGFTFSFYGTTYNSVFVNANGNLTFTGGSSDTNPTFNTFISGILPRIAPFWVDLLPEGAPTGGGVFYMQEPTRFIVTWVQVPYWFNIGTPPYNTFQVVLYNNGHIAFAYENLDNSTLISSVRFALAGVAAGNSGDSCVFKYDSLTNSDPQQTVVAPPGPLDQKQLFFDFVDQHCVMTVRICRGLKFFID